MLILVHHQPRKPRWINDSTYGEERGNGTKEILAQGRRVPTVNVLPGVNEVLKGRRELRYICPQFRLPQHPGSCTEETTLGELVRILVATCHSFPPLTPHLPVTVNVKHHLCASPFWLVLIQEKQLDRFMDRKIV